MPNYLFNFNFNFNQLIYALEEGSLCIIPWAKSQFREVCHEIYFNNATILVFHQQRGTVSP